MWELACVPSFMLAFQRMSSCGVSVWLHRVVLRSSRLLVWAANGLSGDPTRWCSLIGCFLFELIPCSLVFLFCQMHSLGLADLLLIVWDCYQCLLLLELAVVETCSWLYDFVVIIMTVELLRFLVLAVCLHWVLSMTSLLTTLEAVISCEESHWKRTSRNFQQ